MGERVGFTKAKAIDGVLSKKCNLCEKWLPLEEMRWHSKGIRGCVCKKCDTARRKKPKRPTLVYTPPEVLRDFPRSKTVEIIAIPGCPAMMGVELGRGNHLGEKLVRVRLVTTGHVVDFLADQVRAI